MPCSFIGRSLRVRRLVPCSPTATQCHRREKAVCGRKVIKKQLQKRVVRIPEASGGEKRDQEVTCSLQAVHTHKADDDHLED